MKDEARNEAEQFTAAKRYCKEMQSRQADDDDELRAEVEAVSQWLHVARTTTLPDLTLALCDRVAELETENARLRAAPQSVPDSEGFWWGWGVKTQIYGWQWCLFEVFKPDWVDPGRKDLQWRYIDRSGGEDFPANSLWVKAEPPATPGEVIK